MPSLRSIRDRSDPPTQCHRCDLFEIAAIHPHNFIAAMELAAVHWIYWLRSIDIITVNITGLYFVKKLYSGDHFGHCVRTYYNLELSQSVKENEFVLYYNISCIILYI